MPAIRRLLLLLGIANVVVAVVFELAASTIASIGYTVSMSTYRELDSRGVIDHARLADLWGEEYGTDWRKPIEKLAERPLVDLYQTTRIASGVMVINGLILLIAWWCVRRDERRLEA